MVPEKIVLAASLIVIVPEPRVTAPAPLNVPMELLKLFKSRVPATETLLELEKALAAPACRVPAATLVVPE